MWLFILIIYALSVQYLYAYPAEELQTFYHIKLSYPNGLSALNKTEPIDGQVDENLTKDELVTESATNSRGREYKLNFPENVMVAQSGRDLLVHNTKTGSVDSLAIEFVNGTYYLKVDNAYFPVYPGTMERQSHSAVEEYSDRAVQNIYYPPTLQPQPVHYQTGLASWEAVACFQPELEHIYRQQLAEMSVRCKQMQFHLHMQLFRMAMCNNEILWAHRKNKQLVFELEKINREKRSCSDPRVDDNMYQLQASPVEMIDKKEFEAEKQRLTTLHKKALEELQQQNQKILENEKKQNQGLIRKLQEQNNRELHAQDDKHKRVLIQQRMTLLEDVKKSSTDNRTVMLKLEEMRAEYDRIQHKQRRLIEEHKIANARALRLEKQLAEAAENYQQLQNEMFDGIEEARESLDKARRDYVCECSALERAVQVKDKRIAHLEHQLTEQSCSWPRPACRSSGDKTDLSINRVGTLRKTGSMESGISSQMSLAASSSTSSHLPERDGYSSQENLSISGEQQVKAADPEQLGMVVNVTESSDVTIKSGKRNEKKKRKSVRYSNQKAATALKESNGYHGTDENPVYTAFYRNLCSQKLKSTVKKKASERTHKSWREHYNPQDIEKNIKAMRTFTRNDMAAFDLASAFIKQLYVQIQYLMNEENNNDCITVMGYLMEVLEHYPFMMPVCSPFIFLNAWDGDIDAVKAVDSSLQIITNAITQNEGRYGEAIKENMPGTLDKEDAILRLLQAIFYGLLREDAYFLMTVNQWIPGEVYYNKYFSQYLTLGGQVQSADQTRKIREVFRLTICIRRQALELFTKWRRSNIPKDFTSKHLTSFIEGLEIILKGAEIYAEEFLSLEAKHGGSDKVVAFPERCFSTATHDWWGLKETLLRVHPESMPLTPSPSYTDF